MIFITGASGYIGSHLLLKLIENNESYVAVDNFCNSNYESIERIEKISKKNVNFIKGDIGDREFLDEIFKNNEIETVFHFAGLKSISQSIEYPHLYYETNVLNSIKLFEKMREYNVSNIIFSSSATVYGKQSNMPLTEDSNISFPDSPYAQTKYIIEKILRQYSKKYEMNVGILRYFNPTGSHHSGLIGETITGAKNLVPSIMRYLLGETESIEIYGNDFDTIDGSGVRDFIHIDDLINGHLKALNYIQNKKNLKFNIWNLGLGEGRSVFEVIFTFESILNIKLKLSHMPRRKGDIDQYWSDISKAQDELEWYPKKNLHDMVNDSINFLNNLKKIK